MLEREVAQTKTNYRGCAQPQRARAITNPELNPDNLTVSGPFFPKQKVKGHALGYCLLELLIPSLPSMRRF